MSKKIILFLMFFTTINFTMQASQSSSEINKQSNDQKQILTVALLEAFHQTESCNQDEKSVFNETSILVETENNFKKKESPYSPISLKEDNNFEWKKHTQKYSEQCSWCLIA